MRSQLQICIYWDMTQDRATWNQVSQIHSSLLSQSPRLHRMSFFSSAQHRLAIVSSSSHPQSDPRENTNYTPDCFTLIVPMSQPHNDILTPKLLKRFYYTSPQWNTVWKDCLIDGVNRLTHKSAIVMGVSISTNVQDSRTRSHAQAWENIFGTKSEII